MCITSRQYNNNNAQFICIILVVFLAICIAKYFESEETEPIPICSQIAGPLLTNKEENIQNNEITYVNNYEDIRFRDYHLNDQTEFEYNNERNYEFHLENIIFNNNINGRILKQNLNYITNTFNKNIKDAKHKFKKATIKYLCGSIDNINDNWNENDILKCLYFTEAQIVQNYKRPLVICSFVLSEIIKNINIIEPGTLDGFNLINFAPSHLSRSIIKLNRQLHNVHYNQNIFVGLYKELIDIKYQQEQHTLKKKKKIRNRYIRNFR